MITEFGEKVQNALESMEALTWRSKDGNTVRLVDASPEELQRWYKHCHEMLYNTNPWSPGKFEVRKNIQNIWNACNTELFVRVILHEYDTPIKTKKDILEFINGMRSQFDHNIIGDSISVLFNGLEPEFEKITVNKLMDACFDKLDVLNTKLITEKFILAQGIWLTDEEKKDLTEYDSEGKVRNRMEVIKERLAGWINPNARLRISQTGLTYNEFRSLVQLGQMPKISSLSTATLKTLRDKVLLLLDNDLDYHISKWQLLIKHIEKVANAKDIELPVCS